MHRRLLLTGTVALLVGLSLRSSPAQSGPAAPVILSVSGVSQNAAQPTAAVAGSTVTGTVLVHNDYTWTPESDPFQSLVGSGGVPIDPSDPGQRGADVPGGTNVLGLPADRLYVSIDGFVTPLAASAENPAFRTGGGCTPPAGLEEDAGAALERARLTVVPKRKRTASAWRSRAMRSIRSPAVPTPACTCGPPGTR